VQASQYFCLIYVLPSRAEKRSYEGCNAVTLKETKAYKEEETVMEKYRAFKGVCALKLYAIASLKTKS